MNIDFNKLKKGDFKGSIFKSLQCCWEYWEGHDRMRGCEGCVVFLKRLDVCFTAKINGRFHCNTVCNECHYYLETYLPRMHFIHQIDVPAAIYRDLYFWSGNSSWADLCEVQERNLLGMGIERVVHPDSLPIVISSIKNAVLGDPDAPRSCSIFLNNRKHGKLKARIAVYPLSEPSGTNLVLAEHEMG